MVKRPIEVGARGVASRARPRKDPAVEGLAIWSRLLDRVIDPVLGLVAPGVGDVLGSLLGAGVITAAVRRRLPMVVIARMLINLAIDALFGAVPLLGDVFDFAFRANTKNLALLEQRHESRRATARDWMFVIGAALLLIAAIAVAAYVAYRITAWACSAIGDAGGGGGPPPPAERTY